MNRARLAELGFDLGARAAGGRSQGAWFATARDGSPVVLKWTPGAAMAARYAALAPALAELRERGVPVPEYLHVGELDGGVLSAQRRLPGRSEDNPSPVVVARMADCIAAQAGLARPPPAADQPDWGGFIVRALTIGDDNWAMHEPLRTAGPRVAAVLKRIEAVGAGADAAWFPDNGLVHRDLHTDNVLIDDGVLTGIIDWEEACAGDPQFDLVAFAFDLDGHGQPIWDRIDAAGLEAPVLRAYLAAMVLIRTAAAVVHHPDDLPRQLDRAERVFGRYEI